MKKILLVIPTLEGGGAEKNIIYLYKNLDRDKYSVKVLVFCARGKFKNEIKSQDLIDLKCKSGKYAFFKYFKILSTNKPDIVLSTILIANIYSAIVSIFLKKIRFIIRETSVLSVENRSKILNFIYPKVINNVSIIIAQSEDMKVDLLNNYSVDNKKIIVINNPVDFDFIQKKINNKKKFNKEKILISVGRLTPQKGFLEIIDELFKINNMEFKYFILGEGELEEKIKEKIKEKKMDKKIKLIGFKKNPYKYIEEADLFLLPSKYEGFPNVLLESGACGTPILANNCLGGINEIISEDINGRIFDFNLEKDFRNKLNECLQNKWDVRNIKNNTKIKYDINKIIKNYEIIIDEGIKYD